MDFPESWSEDWPGNKMLPDSQSGVVERGWGVPEYGGGLFHVREFVSDDDERIAWAFAIQRSGILEVEEFFVRPQFRRTGYGKKLMHSIGELAVEHGCSLKFWISYADTAPENLAIIEKLVMPLGLRVVPAHLRFAPYVAAAEFDAPQLERPQDLQPRGARPIAPYRPNRRGEEPD
jgi:GNAT superfamily N-acetyltransferase